MRLAIERAVSSAFIVLWPGLAAPMAFVLVHVGFDCLIVVPIEHVILSI